ncbi:MAG: ribosome small subunit-dependent GTPase A [Spirochaetes bacterium]|nr:ribosome small subunit-dependent GTPase A [Spirochaetota bacterium]
MKQGIILWGVRSIFTVLDTSSHQTYQCTIKGKILDSNFAIKGRKEKSPLVVGDKVDFQIINDEQGLILNRLERKNEFKRLKRMGREVQTLVSNIDLLVVVDSIVNPPLRSYFIDRCLFTADYMDIPVLIVFNKIDLMDQADQDLYKEIKKGYESLGYSTLETSIIKEIGLKELKSRLSDKLSSFNGRSGVGKSSLIKKIDPRYQDIKIGEVSKKFDRGIHTTTYARIYDLEFGGMIADTPGIRELAIFIDQPEDVENHFRDFASFRQNCQYYNCQHVNEPNCAVKDALAAGEILEFRYESYLRMRETVLKLKDSKI